MAVVISSRGLDRLPILRQSLLSELGDRFKLRCTVIRAGADFGKTILLDRLFEERPSPINLGTRVSRRSWNLTEFTPVSGTLGGLLIGLSAAALLLMNGRVAGISGILGLALSPPIGEGRNWRIAFLLGLPAGATIVSLVTGPLTTHIEASPPVIIAAGLFVGFGTRLGSGCTSGHGVCGMSRGSARSIAATLTFMAVAGLVVFATRQLSGAIG